MWSLVALTLLFISAAILLSYIPKGLGKKYFSRSRSYSLALFYFSPVSLLGDGKGWD